MKRIILILLALAFTSKAYADCASDLVTGAKLSSTTSNVLCEVFGSAVGQSLIPSADNTYDLGSASLAWRDLFVDRNALIGGTLGVTGIATFGATGIRSSAGNDFNIISPAAKQIIYDNTDSASGSGHLWRVAGNSMMTLSRFGALSLDGTNAAGITINRPASNLTLAGTGSTIAIQEGTAASACSGTVTANGATPVVTSTTCAITGARIFLTKTATSAVNGSCYVSAISTGVSFSITCLATDTGAYNWFIIHEAP